MDETIAGILKEKGESWVVAAMVEGSIGYHSPDNARRYIQDYQNGTQRNYCERCLSCYGGDLEKMILQDVTGFERMEKEIPQRAQRIIDFCSEWEKVAPQDTLNAAGLMYPTLSF